MAGAAGGSAVGERRCAPDGRSALRALFLVYATADEADAYMIYRCFLFFLPFPVSVRHKNTRQPFPGTAERIFMKLLPNDSGENGVCIAVPK